MLGDELAALTAAGGIALVDAMATDKWQGIRSAAARLFAHGCPAREVMIEAQLDSNAELVAQAEDPARVRRNLVPMWRLQLEALLLQHPEAEEALRALVARLQETPPALQQTSQQTWVQTDVAHDRATQYDVQCGAVPIHAGQTYPEQVHPDGAVPR